MLKEKPKIFSWGLSAKLVIIAYSLLQVLRWANLPQFMDIYYHLLTVWGFIKAGGYSGWDFWQYAPFGRIHIYPPAFHIILALFIKLGIKEIMLAKLFEAIMPILFLSVIWNFIKKNYTERLSFFTLIAFSSSFSFYLSFMNNIPAALAMVIGILALDQLLAGRFIRSILLLSLCFYIHIGVSWFFAFIIILYGLFNAQYRKISLITDISAIILSIPILFKQVVGLEFISPLNINERYFCEFKTIDYALAFFGLILIGKLPKSYRLFLSFFLASFLFLLYPYRFFSAQGYLPIIFLSALSLDALCEKFRDKKKYSRYPAILITVFILLISPTVLMEKSEKHNKISYKVYIFDSAFMNMMLFENVKRIASRTLWFPDVYLPTASLIKQNSQETDIIYSSLDNVGVCLASISGRATANSLLPEVGAFKKFNPIIVSKIFIALQDDDLRRLKRIVDRYNLIKIGENKLFIIYKNPTSYAKAEIRKASLSFGVIWLIGLIFTFLFWQAEKLEGFIRLRRKLWL